MRNKFTELVNAGVAAFHHEPIAGGMPEPLDTITRLYNIYWGAATDTHMSVTPEGRRIITGSLTQNPEKWGQLICSPYWGGISWAQSGYRTLGEFLQRMCLEPIVTAHNGEQCLELVSMEKCPCTAECPACCCTTESAIPQPIGVLGATNELNAAFNNACSRNELVENLNRSNHIKGDRWFVYENKVCCPIGDKTYIIEATINKGNIVADPKFRELMDQAGLGDVQLVQYDKFFRLESEEQTWKRLFRGWKDNKIMNRSFDERTPEDWLEQIQWMLSTFN